MPAIHFSAKPETSAMQDLSFYSRFLQAKNKCVYPTCLAIRKLLLFGRESNPVLYQWYTDHGFTITVFFK
jgi:hypothetical protein